MAKKNNIGKRIILSEDTQAIIIRLVEKLKQKGNHIKVKPVPLVSTILELFEKKYFENEMPYLENCFFDNKLFLQNLISNSKNQTDLNEHLSKYLKNQQPTKERRPKKAPEG